MKKTYACTYWPFLRLGGIQFRDGVYSTDDEDTQAMIERNDVYGVHIHLVSEPVPPEKGDPPVTQEESAPRRGPGRPPGSGARQGQTGTGNLRPSQGPSGSGQRDDASTL